ncbi:MAG: UDP-N-acetylmuramoyl-L-alanine--D-glutamate ligase [Gammaproteobacteria bacterium]|nr:UDP-N-acetylmuramoyl-L-alanine--D-glutamate ligase [Gammaproteobacteria bacterium]
MNAAKARKRRNKQAMPERDVVERDLVFGLGASGVSVARYLARNHANAIYIDTREQPPGLDALKELQPDAEVVLGRPTKDLLDGISRVIVSPGIPDSDPFLRAARDKGVPVISDIALFVAEAKAPFVAVTGSNGKSTVTTLIALMCDAAGKKSLAGANLGRPALDLLTDAEPDIYVLELSSFQLQRTPELPAKVAVLLNISPDHLDWHGSVEEYREAKYRIFDEAASAVFNRQDETAANRVPESLPSVSFGLDQPAQGQYGIRNEEGQSFLARGDQLLLSTADMVLVGVHNQANALAALAAGELLGLDLSPMLQVLHEFPGLPHRMQFVRRRKGVDYINDSKATNVGAAAAAVESLPGLVVLIAGGDGKGGDFAEFAKAVCAKLRAAVLIGRDAPLLGDAFDLLAPVVMAGDMKAAVQKAAELAQPGDTVLLAPACASFDQYQNYQQRGEHFCQITRSLAA